MIRRIDWRTPEPDACKHGMRPPPAGAEYPADPLHVRELYPRFTGTCPACGFSGIAYLSREHYVMGDW